MKTLAVLSLFLALSAHASMNPDMAKLVGTYESGGARFEVFPMGNSLGLRTKAELTKEPGCHTRLGPPIGRYFDSRYPGAAEVYFQLDRGNCPGIDGRVTLHYNRSIFGQDIFLIDVMVQRNSLPQNSRSHSNQRSVRWSLRKLN